MKSIKVGLIGFGTIGCGVVKILQDNQNIIRDRLGASVDVVKIADLDITTEREVKVGAGVLTTDVNEVLDHPDIDVVVELMGGYEPARSFILKRSKIKNMWSPPIRPCWRCMAMRCLPPPKKIM